MLTDTFVVAHPGQTDGILRHTGRLIVTRRLDTGELLSVTLPDDLGVTDDGPSQADFDALVARVAALEAVNVPNSLEDLTYGG